jgi:hypothetical protein
MSIPFTFSVTMIIEDGIKAQGVSLDNGINFYFLFLDLTIALSKNIDALNRRKVLESQ